MDVSLDGKVALVTGAGPNIGSGIALALARYGARVACNDIDAGAAEACVRRIARSGGTAMAIPGDVSKEDDVVAYVRTVLDAWGRIDILVNNAALLGGRGVLDESAGSFTRAVLVAALGNFLNTKHVARSMCERGIRGSIVCISSSNGWSGSPGVIAYAFHKGGVNNFARAAAMDLAPYGIRVNTFTPTMVTPDNPDLAVPPAGRRGRGIGGEGGDEPWRRPARWQGERAPLVPMGTTGTPTDIGHCVAWICSDFARLITGADFVVDGGARARNFAHVPAAPGELMGPSPLVELDVAKS
ncbi:MAG TPA: SDR family oxidoreductase [Candidatus Eisenbacteria bacterium]|nr:SDR family oxidoreductase [Candidatus Eisenbacteria bacterium]